MSAAATCAEATRTAIHSKADAAAVSGITSRNFALPSLFHHAEATRPAIHSKADASAGSNKGGRSAWRRCTRGAHGHTRTALSHL